MNYALKLFDALLWPLVILLFIWIAFLANVTYRLDLNFYGLRPREIQGLIGILAMPFLHGDLDHIASNSLPFLLSLGFLFLYFPQHKWKIFGLIWLTSGILLWLFAKSPSNHIGASGVLYGLISFIVFHAFINRNKESLAAAFVLIFLYGGIIYGLFPEYGILIGKPISWEGHLSGFIMGGLFAFIFRRNGPQQIVFFEDEDEDDDFGEDENPYWLNDNYTFNYVPNNDKKEE